MHPKSLKFSWKSIPSYPLAIKLNSVIYTAQQCNRDVSQYLPSTSKNTWGHCNSRPDFTYNNFALNHKSCIDHFIVSRDVYDNIHLNHVICDPTNLSNHNSIQLVIDTFQTPINLIDSSCNDPLKQ